MIKDPICAVLAITDDDYRVAYNKRNFNDQSTLDNIRAITSRRLEDMTRIASIEACQSTDEEIAAMLVCVQDAFKEEADSCIRHGQIKECAAALRAANAIAVIVKRYQITKE